jgi:DNA polymerase III gamma/tau subunit
LNDLVGIPDNQKVMNLLTGIAGHDAAGVLDAIEQLIDSGQSSVQICDLLIQNMRDMMVFQSAGADSKVLVLTDEEKKQLQQVADKFDIAALIYNITALEKLRWTLRTSETSRALLEASLLRLALSEHFIGLDQLSAKLSAAPSAGAPLGHNRFTKNRYSISKSRHCRRCGYRFHSCFMANFHCSVRTGGFLSRSVSFAGVSDFF